MTGAYGVGLALVETYTGKDGEPRNTRYTAWFDTDPGTAIGDTITVSGFLSAKVDTWTGSDGQERTTAKISLNKAKLSSNTPRAEAAPVLADEDLPF
jgi:hypothetical protein